MVISCAEAVHSMQMLSLGQTQDPLTGPAGLQSEPFGLGLYNTSTLFKPTKS